MQHGMVWVGLGLLPGNRTDEGSPDDLDRLAGFIGAMAQSNADQGRQLAPPLADRRTRRAPRPAPSPSSPADSSSPAKPSSRSRRRGVGRGVPPQFFDGLHHGDTDRLRRVSLPKAVYTSATGGSSFTSRWTSTSRSSTRPSRTSRREPRRDRVVWMEKVGPVTAVARVGRDRIERFHDVLTLVRLDVAIDGRSSAKVFHYELVEGARRCRPYT